MIAAAARGGPALRGQAGDRRVLLYLFAACTGLRAKECASVRRGDFGPGLALVKVAGEFTKNGKEAVQPIPSLTAPGGRGGDRGARRRRFPLAWRQEEG